MVKGIEKMLVILYNLNYKKIVGIVKTNAGIGGNYGKGFKFGLSAFR